MAKPKTSRSTGESSPESYRLVPFDFSRSEVGEFEDWLRARPADYQPDVIKVLDSGWKVSYSYSPHYGLYFLSITGKSTETQYDGYTISLKHPDFDRLFSVLEYVALVLCQDARVPLPPTKERGGW